MVVALPDHILMKPAKLAVPETMINLKRWYGEVSARPSAKA